MKSSSIEDYALIGNTRSAGLVARDGSVDWLCVPRFDSPACFAALLGEAENGRWKIAPTGKIRATRRRYRDDTLVLETEFDTEDGTVRLIDCMPIWHDRHDSQRNDIVRLVEGVSGRVAMHMEWIVRFDYGSVTPWVHRAHGGLIATAGADSVILHTPIKTHGHHMTTVADFEISKGEVLPLVMSHFPSHHAPPLPVDPLVACAMTTHHWKEWSAQCSATGPHTDAVRRSLITLKALTYSPSGGIVAAPTAALPELMHGTRNWDYRYCWLRDATFTLQTLWHSGYEDEALAWREWLLRAAAGRPEDLRTLYGVCGERRLEEWTVPWLPGYRGSSPVRIGNAASSQLQLDVFGEIMNTLHLSRRHGMDHNAHAWQVQLELLNFLESNWQQPDNGIWEIRGPRRQFTHSNAMCWVAFDRAIRTVEEFKVDGPLDRWRKARDQIKQEICEQAFDRERNTFVQAYDKPTLDASLLLLPLVGFLPADDERMQGTVAAIERELLHHGFVRRYVPDEGLDGLAGDEGVFLPCSFWLVDNYALQGRKDKALKLLEKLLALQNDVGLLPEEYDPVNRCFLGNFPQAFTHVGLVNSARNVQQPDSSGEQKSPGAS